MNLSPVQVNDLGLIPYREAWGCQEDFVAQRIREEIPDTLLLAEHLHVITLGRRAKREHLLASETELARAGVELVETNRGGDITCHGPGQLVAYPIFHIGKLGLTVHRYIRALEGCVIEALKTWDLEGRREKGATGVWIGESKIAAIGIRIRKLVSFHGLALNVNPDLSQYERIIPCGLHGRSVTSLAQLLGPRCPAMPEVKKVLIRAFVKMVSV